MTTSMPLTRSTIAFFVECMWPGNHWTGMFGLLRDGVFFGSPINEQR
jgi:hypothetical protein